MIHVLQVHKEPITKVPNAKPDRESTELEIFGMEGIPSEILAAHDRDQDDEKPVKVAKVEFPSLGGGALTGASTLARPLQPLYPPLILMYTPPLLDAPARLPTWPLQPPLSQSWPSGPMIPMPAPVTQPTPPLPPPQRLFPIQGVSAPPNMPTPPTRPSSQSLFPIQAPMPPMSSSVPPSQPLFPLNGPSVTPLNASMPVFSNALPLRATMATTAASEAGAALGSAPVQCITSSSSIGKGRPSNFPAYAGVVAGPVASGHMHGASPNIGVSNIGPSPVISNRAPVQGISNEVYLVWDDEAMSMEERRLSLPLYQMHDEAFQMNSVDAAIDRRILESRLAGRMVFGV